MKYVSFVHWDIGIPLTVIAAGGIPKHNAQGISSFLSFHIWWVTPISCLGITGLTSERLPWTMPQVIDQFVQAIWGLDDVHAEVLHKLAAVMLVKDGTGSAVKPISSPNNLYSLTDPEGTSFDSMGGGLFSSHR